MVDKGFLLACPLAFSLALYPYLAQGHLARYGATHSGLVPSTSVLSQDLLIDMAIGQLDLASP